MKKVFVSRSLVEVESLKELLDQAGIVTTVKNQSTSMLAGEVPFAEVFPELWVINDNEYSDATRLLDDWKQSQQHTLPDWTCDHCGETHSGEFTTCWNCGKDQ